MKNVGGHFAADPIRALSTDRADYCIPPSRCGPLFQLCKTLFMDGVMDIPVSQQCSRFTTESFHAVFVARHRSSTSSHPEASKAFGASDELIHSKNCRALHRTLKPQKPLEPLTNSFTAKIVEHFVAP